MKPKLAVVFLSIILLPLGLLGWLGARASRNEQEVVRQNFREVLVAKLKDTDSSIAEIINERERNLLRLTETPLFSDLATKGKSGALGADDAEAIRDLARKTAWVKQMFVLAPSGNLLHPSLSGDMNASERDFLWRSRRFLLDKELLHLLGTKDTPARRSQAQAQGQGQNSPHGDTGWYVWYWENGLNLIFWRRLESGHVIGVELEPARLLSDIIARLPNTDLEDRTLPSTCITLVDSNGKAVYQWGGYQPAEHESARATLGLSSPLNSWHLDYYLPATGLDAALKGSWAFNFTAAFLCLGAALMGLAAYFYREYTRDVREASQRVNFVNQVSHELKTPLTNIRMYAELLEARLCAGHPDAATATSASASDERDDKAKRYLDVIVAESQRLSRLIANVLTFAREQKGETRTLHMSPGSVDDTIAGTLHQFRPVLDAKNVALEFSGRSPETVMHDADALRQILGNLLGNVEKYGCSGGRVEITSAQQDGLTTIIVSDHGPGIPKGEEERIFEPFYRLSRELSDGVTGTGIGLTIARDLARMHGGDLVLDHEGSGKKGACFRLTLRTPVEKKAVGN